MRLHTKFFQRVRENSLLDADHSACIYEAYWIDPAKGSGHTFRSKSLDQHQTRASIASELLPLWNSEAMRHFLIQSRKLCFSCWRHKNLPDLAIEEILLSGRTFFLHQPFF